MLKFDNRPKNAKQKTTLAKVSGWLSGSSWFLLFSVLFTDQLFVMAEEGSDAALYLCIGPFFILSMLGFALGAILSLVSRARQPQMTEEDADFSANGLKYGLLGISFVLLAPLLNQLLAPIGIQLYDITSFFRP